MKSVIASLVAVAGLSAAAVAEVNTRMDVLVSLDGINWAPTVNANAGTTVQVLVRASYIGSAQPLGFASANFQPTVSNWTAGDVALAYAGGGFGSNTTNPANIVPAGAAGAGQYGRISPMGRTALTSSQAITNHVHLASGGANQPPTGSWLRIAQKQVTSWIGGTGNTTGGSGVNVAQLNDNGRTAADPAFLPALQNVELFRFGVTIGAVGTRTQLDVDLPLDGFGNRNSAGDREVYWFATMFEGSGSIRGTAEVHGGTIILPAPASMALLGLGGLCVARRRR